MGRCFTERTRTVVTTATSPGSDTGMVVDGRPPDSGVVTNIA
jgi:hypothetical protein